MRRNHAFTLIELLIGIALLGTLMLVLSQIFGTTLSASSKVSARADLISEAQLAQQVVASRLQQAWYIYPAGTVLQLSSTNTAADWSTKDTISGANDQSWTVGTDPIIAMILPPAPGSSQYRFFAYYAMKRSDYVSNATPSTLNPGADAANDNAVWVLMQYQALFSAATLKANLPSATDYRNASPAGRMLVDYVQPSTTAPTYTMFSYDASARLATFRLRMLRTVSGAVTQVTGTGGMPLDVRVTPRNTNF